VDADVADVGGVDDAVSMTAVSMTAVSMSAVCPDVSGGRRRRRDDVVRRHGCWMVFDVRRKVRDLRHDRPSAVCWAAAAMLLPGCCRGRIGRRIDGGSSTVRPEIVARHLRGLLFGRGNGLAPVSTAVPEIAAKIAARWPGRLGPA